MFTVRIGVLRSYVFVAALCLIPIGGCAVIDRYGSRATEYNQQTAVSKSSTILLNIMRAAYREPLQFTEISTVTGTASAQGGLNAALPLRVGGTPFTSPQILDLNPSASFSGGPNFSVANLNTQEFYLGLQSPVPTQIIANYMASGINSKILLPLLISDIAVDNPDTNTRTVLHGRGTEKSYRVFLGAIESLLHYGLTVGQTVRPDEKFGPVLTHSQASDPQFLSSLVQAMSSGGASLSLRETKNTNGQSEFQLTKPGGTSGKFCFLEKQGESGEPTTGIGEQAAYEVSSLRSNSVLRVNPELAIYKGEVPLQLTFIIDRNSCLSSGKPRMNINFTTRSVQGIITFLGEMVRTQLGLGSEPGDLSNPNGNPVYLFKVEQRLPTEGDISATIHGLPYVVSVDPSGADASSQVLQLLSDLLALQSKAKDLPAPNVIAVVP